MKKRDFLYLLLGTVGGLLFSAGMCMCLLSEWNAFQAGVWVTAIGGVTLLVLLVLSLRGRTTQMKINWKLVGRICYGIISALVFGTGMCMIMVWQLMIPGITVGVVGIVMLLCLIPMCMGLK